MIKGHWQAACDPHPLSSHLGKKKWIRQGAILPMTWENQSANPTCNKDSLYLSFNAISLSLRLR
ncbi:hypothetical protein K450DRAFT_222457 [Umbelopsis ramanniana AG]|uniref:Uncharacterized protein n=1 Tax=Umbelopsis ramanniana AG TaxID=1314678 RepID=A0AAD5EIX6_UMBRA|nr:uncharacterized protein K450DRAFT_222457 [Umbelopsis ramanniana AG]KAI8583721.1 hypothetical protein K450DRAFT_222457 [Umbelopsis ramanniana AG]